MSQVLLISNHIYVKDTYSLWDIMNKLPFHNLENLQPQLVCLVEKFITCIIQACFFSLFITTVSK